MERLSFTKLQDVLRMLLVGDLRFDYEYKIEYEYDFSILFCRLHAITSHIQLTITNMKSEGSGNVTGVEFENHTRTQSRTIPIYRSLFWTCVRCNGV